jgi:hypothetical protein
VSRAERLSVGVVVERRRTCSVWQSEAWCVAKLVLPGELPDVRPWTVLEEGSGWQRLYAGEVPLELFAGDTGAYRDNLQSSRPAVYVVLRRDGERGVALREATVDPGEIEAHADAGDDLIEAVPLPPAIAAWIADFVARHHVEQPFWKRRRDRADPEALGRRPIASRGERGHG